MTRVDIPGVGLVDFPDTMSDEEISNTIKNKYYSLGDAFYSAMDNLHLNSSEFLNYLQTELMRTANYLVTNV